MIGNELRYLFLGHGERGLGGMFHVVCVSNLLSSRDCYAVIYVSYYC